MASHLDGKEPSELLDDVRQFARRRPGTFLLGALAAGVVVGRLTRGAKAAQDKSPADRAGTSTPSSPSTGAPTQVGIVPEVDRSAVAYTDADLDNAGTQTGLGTKGVEMSEAGVPRANGGHA
jgi:hypothetical protein